MERLFDQLTGPELRALDAKLRHAGDQFSAGTSGQLTAWQRMAQDASIDMWNLRGDLGTERDIRARGDQAYVPEQTTPRYCPEVPGSLWACEVPGHQRGHHS